MAGRILSLTAPVDSASLLALNAGDQVEISGEILVFRDQVHKILCELIEKGEELPVDIDGAMLYYCGPTPARNGMPVGSAGPTTSSRMDAFTVPLLERGLKATIGKGNRSDEVVEAMKRHGAVYFVAVGGTGAYLAKKITASRVVAYPEFGPEAARIFTVDAMPLFVGVDSHGKSAFK